MQKTGNLGQLERVVLNVLDGKAPGECEVVAGHDIREQLLALGHAKREVVLAMGSLVERGVIERLKVVDEDGLFYTGYRRVA